MATIDIKDVAGKTVKSVELNDAVFGIEPNIHVMHTVVRAYRAGLRQGTANTKTRGEVRGGGKKPWRQKGTGRARQGSIRSPQWVGGGVVFAPKPRDYSKKVNKKARRVALKSALTSKVQEEKFIVLDQLTLDAIKTKDMQKVLDAFKLEKALIVLAGENENVVLSARNIPGVKTTPAELINVYDILKYETFFTTKDAVAKIEEVFQ